MDFELSDSSGTDDDLPPSNRNRFQGGAPGVGNGRSGTPGSSAVPRVHKDMETQIHDIELEAYTSVLRAFKAQSDAITWEQESLITELRKELHVSDEEHRLLLSRVNADDVIRRIRDWRKAQGSQPGIPSASQPAHNAVPSATFSASRKKQKTSHSVASLSTSAPTPAQQMPHASTSNIRKGPQPGSKSKRPKSFSSADLAGRNAGNNHVSSGGFARNETAEAIGSDPLIGRKVWTRWPEDNNFYEAVITDYNPVEGRHALVYDVRTANETWEWVNLKEMSPQDIRWEGDDPKISHRGSHPGSGRGNKKSMARGGAVAEAGRGRGALKPQSRTGFPLHPNGIFKKVAGDIEILHTDTLIKEVERVFNASHPDPKEVEKAKEVLKEQEEALIDAIAKLEGASDGEGGYPRLQKQSMDQDRGWQDQLCH